MKHFVQVQEFPLILITFNKLKIVLKMKLANYNVNNLFDSIKQLL